MTPIKVQILNEVAEIVGKRGFNYGTPEDNFDRIARRWNAHLFNRYGEEGPEVLDSLDVAMMCIDLKLARIENEPLHMDSWKDVCGYGACGGEIAQNRVSQSWVDAKRNGADKKSATLGGPPPQPCYEFGTPKVGDVVGAFNAAGEWRTGTVRTFIDGFCGVECGAGLWLVAAPEECIVLSRKLKSETAENDNKPDAAVNGC